MTNSLACLIIYSRMHFSFCGVSRWSLQSQGLPVDWLLLWNRFWGWHLVILRVLDNLRFLDFAARTSFHLVDALSADLIVTVLARSSNFKTSHAAQILFRVFSWASFFNACTTRTAFKLFAFIFGLIQPILPVFPHNLFVCFQNLLPVIPAILVYRQSR